MSAPKIDILPLFVLTILFTTNCRPSPAPQGSDVSGSGNLPCSLASDVRELTNPQKTNSANEKKFYQIVREEGSPSGGIDWKKISSQVGQFKQTLASDACQKSGLRCRLALISKKTKHTLKVLSYAPYAHTLKVREIAGRERILVKGFGAEPFVDPRQPGGVFRRYQNGYVWFFRTHVGDLHPGFILGKLKGEAPEHINSMLFEVPRSGGSPGSMQRTYSQVLMFHQDLIDLGFLQQINRGYNDDPLQTLYLINRHKIQGFANNARLKQRAETIFGKDRAQSVLNIIKGLLEERAKPTILPSSKGKFEITKENLEAMGRDLPFVSIQNGTVQCSDHHRIMAAHDLGMAIEVGVFHGFVSFN